MDRQGKTALSYHLVVRPTDRGLRPPLSDCGDHAILSRPLKVPDSDPRLDCQCRNMFRLIGKPTGTLDGNASFVIRLILLMKLIAAVLHSRESIRK